MYAFNDSSFRNLILEAAEATTHRGWTWGDAPAPAATESEIEELTRVVGVALPSDFVAFLRVANGVTYSVVQPEENFFHDTLKIWGTAEISKFYTLFLAGDLEWPLLLPFAKYAADFVVFDTRHSSGDDYPIIFVEHDNPALAYEDDPIALTFRDWLASSLREVKRVGAFGYWLDE